MKLKYYANFHYINMRTDQINVLRRIVNDLNVLEDSPYKKKSLLIFYNLKTALV